MHPCVLPDLVKGYLFSHMESDLKAILFNCYLFNTLQFIPGVQGGQYH